MKTNRRAFVQHSVKTAMIGFAGATVFDGPSETAAGMTAKAMPAKPDDEGSSYVNSGSG